MKKGFTLSEVLVTLTVIGIIAAITIPSIAINFHRHVQYVAFMKMYSTLSSVMELAQADHKKPNRWTFDPNNRTQVLRDNIYPYLNIAQICEAQGNEKCVDYMITALSGGESANASIFMQGGGHTVFLDDGTILATYCNLSIDGGVKVITFIFDTNGDKKPNTAGRDIFVMDYTADENGKWGFLLDGDTYGAQNCNPSDPDSTGEGCPSRLIDEGKMNY